MEHQLIPPAALYNPGAQDSPPVKLIDPHNGMPRIKNMLCTCPEILIVDDIDYNRWSLQTIFEEVFNLTCI